MTQGLTLIAAVARNGVIGCQNALPWHLPEDLRHFKALTTGHAVIMGRKTWESLPERFRPLPGRLNIVLTRRPDYAAPGAQIAGSLEGAMATAGEHTPYVIGGAELYALALPLADRLALTEIDADFPGDAFFPHVDPAVWRIEARTTHRAEAGFNFSFVSYRRIR